MVKRLFHENVYATECDAKIVWKEGNCVKLDQTVFYAYSGGQASDSGTISGIPVVSARKEDGDIVYELEAEPNVGVGESVHVVIDGEKRKKLMRMHSAIHIVYFVLKDLVGAEKLIGSDVKEEKGRLDYAYEGGFSEVLSRVEEEVNKIFNSDHAIETYADSDVAGKRHWKSMNWECPCGGTHPSNTKEIGSVRLKRKTIGKGKERVEVRWAE